MKINQRHTLFSKPEEVSLGNDALVRTRNGVEKSRIEFADVKSVTLVCDGTSPAHAGTMVYRCIVQSRTTKIVFSNALYGKKDPAMDAKYLKVVRGLHQRLQPYADNIRFTQGNNLWFYASWAGLIASVLLLILFPIVLFGTGNLSVLRKLWVIVLLPVMTTGIFLPLIKKGRSKGYETTRLPAAYLPE